LEKCNYFIYILISFFRVCFIQLFPMEYTWNVPLNITLSIPNCKLFCLLLLYNFFYVSKHNVYLGA
jgi:hypothetical protein